MKNSIDTRVKIAKTLNTLLRKQEIQTIKVVDICHQCNISRTTFYKYFSNIYDIHNWLWKFYLLNCMKSIYVQNSWKEALLRFFSALKEHDSLFQNSEKGNTPYEEEGFQNMTQLVREKLYKRGIYLTDQEKIILKYALYMQSAATSKWIRDGMIESPKEMSLSLMSALPNFIPNK